MPMRREHKFCAGCGTARAVARVADLVHSGDADAPIRKEKRYCPSCGSENPPEAAFCAACGVSIAPQKKAEKEKTPKKKRTVMPWVALACVLGMILLIVGGVYIYNNSGGYSIENYGVGSRAVHYRGSLQHLVSNNNDLLRDFLSGEVDNKAVAVLYCKDYRIYNLFGVGGTVDVAEDGVTFYEEGLVKVDTNSDYVDRFRSDFTVEIQKEKSDYRYYFCSRYDALEWLERRF